MSLGCFLSCFYKVNVCNCLKSYLKLYNCCLLTLYNNLKVLVHSLWDRQLDLNKPSLRTIFNKSLYYLIWPKKVALALTSALFDVLLPFLYGTKSDFLGEVTPVPMDKTTKLAQSSVMIVQRNSLRGCDS
jgi:hypothetical protein